MKKTTLLVFSLALAVFTVACSKDETASGKVTGVNVAVGEDNPAFGKLVVLNEGNFGSNGASLDYFSYSEGNWYRNVYSALNPSVTLGLGDTGNDLAEYGGELWAVMNGSSLIEIMDASTLRHKAAIRLMTPRNVCFDGGYAYVSSYNGNSNERGKVYKIDISRRELVDSTYVGPHPEGIAVKGGKVYTVCGYTYNPDFTMLNDLYVLDSRTLASVKKVSTGYNPSKLALIGSRLYVVTSDGLRVLDTAADSEISVSGVSGLYVDNLASDGERIYAYSSDWSGARNHVLYVIDTVTGKSASHAFGDYEALEGISVPYGIAANPATGDIYIADAIDYNLSPGSLYCMDSALAFKWKATTGIFPGHICIY